MRAKISLYCGLKTKVRVEPKLPDEFLVQVGVYLESV